MIVKEPAQGEYLLDFAQAPPHRHHHCRWEAAGVHMEVGVCGADLLVCIRFMYIRARAPGQLLGNKCGSSREADRHIVSLRTHNHRECKVDLWLQLSLYFLGTRFLLIFIAFPMSLANIANPLEMKPSWNNCRSKIHLLSS